MLSLLQREHHLTNPASTRRARAVTDRSYCSGGLVSLGDELPGALVARDTDGLKWRELIPPTQLLTLTACHCLPGSIINVTYELARHLYRTACSASHFPQPFYTHTHTFVLSLQSIYAYYSKWSFYVSRHFNTQTLRKKQTKLICTHTKSHIDRMHGWKWKRHMLEYNAVACAIPWAWYHTKAKELRDKQRHCKWQYKKRRQGRDREQIERLRTRMRAGRDASRITQSF